MPELGVFALHISQIDGVSDVLRQTPISVISPMNLLTVAQVLVLVEIANRLLIEAKIVVL